MRNQKGAVAPALILGAVLLVGLVVTSDIKIVKNFPSQDQHVLGKGSDDGDSSDKDEDKDKNKSGSSGSSSGSSPKPDDKDEVEVKPKEDDGRVKTEIRFGEGEKIKTRVEEGKSRIDVYSGGVKVRYEIRDGRVIIKAETEEGEDVEEQELLKIVDRIDKAGIKVATEGGKLLLQRNSVAALTNFPLQIDLNTNQLIASTSAGPRVLTVLPDQAIANMLAANIIATDSSSLTSVADVVRLAEQNGAPVYQINGIRNQKLLGFIPVTTRVSVTVSAETGELVTQEQSLFASIIDLLSP